MRYTSQGGHRAILSSSLLGPVGTTFVVGFSHNIGRNLCCISNTCHLLLSLNLKPLISTVTCDLFVSFRPTHCHGQGYLKKDVGYDSFYGYFHSNCLITIIFFMSQVKTLKNNSNLAPQPG